MPNRPARPCRKPGCPGLCYDRSGYCTVHKKLAQGRTSPQRLVTQHLYGARWQQARARFLADNPLCVECLKIGKQELATVVDHHVPHGGDSERFWDETNWRALCDWHHRSKTAKYDGGLGNRRKGKRLD